MSGPSGSGVPPPAGVVCNSALSFVASAQALPTENESAQGNLQEASGEQAQADRAVPAGLKALYDACTLLYPDQPNPLQVTTRLKYWLGGEDPLDYISMYWNPGKPEEHIPPHWHYISFGLSDLHGDGRVHPWSESQSGYGLELSMRVCADGAGPPPLWPAALCQALARYVFTTGNKFCAGDHISWHRPLDGRERGRIRHLLVAADPALPTQHTPHGTVEFLQLVGCTSRELKAAQRGSGFEVLKMMKEDPNAGGPFLVTRPSRVSSCRVSSVHSSAPASLAGVSCCVRWLPLQKYEESSDITAGVEKQIKDTLQRGLTAMSTDSNGKGAAVGHMSTDSFEMSSIERALPQITDTVSSWRDEETVRYFDSVHIFLNAEGASLLPLALDGRIKHDRHFTWRGGDCAVTLLSPRVSGAFATDKEPYAARGGWLQVVVTSEMAALLGLHSRRLRALETPSEPESDSEAPAPALPLSISAKSLNITVTY